MTTRNRELASIIDDSDNITAGGNLTVSGTTLTASSTVETHADPLIELNTGAGSNSNDLGFVFERGSTGDNACIIWDESNDGFAVGTTTATGTSTGNMTFTAADFAAGKVTVDNILINGTTIGHTSDTDLLTFADGVLTVAGEVSMTTLDIGGTNVTSTAAELNILDGVTSTAAELNILDGVTATAAEINFLDGDTSATGTTLASADRVIVNDGGTMKQVALSDFETFFESEIDTFSTIDINGGTIDGATVGANSASTGAFTTLSASGLTTNGASEGDTYFTGGTANSRLLNVYTSTNNSAANAGHNFKIASGEGAFIFGNNTTANLLTVETGGITVTGEVAATSLDISGDVDVDGTLEADAITVNGTALSSVIAGTTLTQASQTNITSVGTIGTGVWQGTAIAGGYIANDAIDSQHYADNSIDEAHISDNAVGTDQLVDSGVTNSKIATQAVTAAKIQDGCISLVKMASQSVDEDNLYISNSGSNGQFLSKQSGNSGGLTWADAGGTTINGNTDNYVVTGTGTSNTLQGESGLLFVDGRNLGLGVTPEANWANDNNAVQVGGLGAVWGKTTAAAAKHTTLSNNVYDHPSTGQAAIVTDEGAKITLTNGTILLATTPAATTADAAHSWNAGINIAADGIVGIDVVPETDWHSDWKALQVGAGTLSTLTTGAQTSFAQNARGTTGSSNGGWKYIESLAASQYVQDAGNHYFKYAASGSADGTITWTQAMNIGSNGRVGIGETSPDELLHITAASGDANIRMEGSAVRIKKSGSDWLAYDGSNLKLSTGNTERMRINSSGNVGIAITPESWNTDFRAIQMGTGGSSVFGGATTNRNVGLGQNTYLSTGGDWKYTQADHASLITAYDGTMEFNVAGSGSADANISWTNAVKIDNAGNVTKPAQPMFDAGRNAGYQTDDAYFIQDFSRVNVGSHYNTSTGKFTAPIAGTYFFTFSIMTHDSGSTVQAVVQLRQNGNTKMNFLQHKTGAYHTRVTGNMILTLAANDYVQTYVGDSGTSSGWHGSAQEYNVFGGFLIG